MLKKLLSLFGIFALGLSISFQPPIFAQAKPSEISWQQPYAPTHLQWLAVNLQGGSRTECGVYSRDDRSRAFYTWKIPSFKDNRLVIFVLTLSSKDADVDRNFCMGSAFTRLQTEALRMDLKPPQVELMHSQSGKDSSQPFLKTYQCSIPVAATEKEIGTLGGFRDLCRLGEVKNVKAENSPVFAVSKIRTSPSP